MAFAWGSREAVGILQGARGVELHSLHVDFNFNNQVEEEDWTAFGDFVTAVEENQTIPSLILERGEFDQTHETLDRLFGQVLPSHRFLRRITLLRCEIMTEYVRMFETSLANSRQSLELLSFDRMFGDHQGLVALSNNLLRANAQIERLELRSCEIRNTGCQVILEGLKGNTQLRELDLTNNIISEINLTGVKALASSSLRRLDLCSSRLTHESVHTLVQGLRTNFFLEELDIGPRILSQFSYDLIEELLASFNFTLRRLQVVSNDTMPSQRRIDRLLQLNVSVRNAHDSLQLLDYRVPELSAWPDVLACISSKPSLLYRFVRRGNLDAFTSQMLHDPHEGLRRSRRRRRSLLEATGNGIITGS